MDNRIFQHKDIISIFPDLSPRSLVSWAEKGILEPSYVDAEGRGTIRKYSFDDVIFAGIIRELMQMGFTFRDVQRYLTDHWKDEIKKYNYECVFILQKLLMVSLTSDNKRKLFTRIDPRVYSIEDYEKNKGRLIFETTTIDPSGNLTPIGVTPTISSVLVVNIERIKRHVAYMVGDKITK